MRARGNGPGRPTGLFADPPSHRFLVLVRGRSATSTVFGRSSPMSLGGSPRACSGRFLTTTCNGCTRHRRQHPRAGGAAGRETDLGVSICAPPAGICRLAPVRRQASSRGEVSDPVSYQVAFKDIEVIHLNPVIDWVRTGSASKATMPLVRACSTWSRLRKTWFAKQSSRRASQMCSAGLSSGLYGGRNISRMLSGTLSSPAMCQPAWSMTMKTNSVAWRWATSARNIDIVSALTQGSTRLSITPS